jgi:hypothetical protein
MRKTLLAILLVLSTTSLLAAEVHYVSATGTDTWANSTNIGTPCSLATANANVAAGDTVYLRGGTYSGITGAAIGPVNTGTSGNVITFSSYNSEDVQLVGSGTSSIAVDLNSDYGTVRSYIKIHDLHFTDFMRHLWILKGDYCEVSYCSFVGYPATAAQTDFEWFQASYIYRQAEHNWVHHCTFGKWGYNATFGYDTGGPFGMGAESNPGDLTRYNTVENCEMYWGGHHVICPNGTYNVYRNNYFHNEPWYPLAAPVHSTRVGFQTGLTGEGYNLMESNRFGYGGPKNKDEIGGTGSSVCGENNLWRYNEFVNIYTKALWFQAYPGQSDVIYNHFYNNTFWHGGYGTHQKYPDGEDPSPYWFDDYSHAICIEEGADCHDNVFKNNLFYQGNNTLGAGLSIISVITHTVPTNQILANNWLDNAGDPKFVDISGTADPMNWNQYNFSLQPSSPCIDAGGSLTLASGSGSGSTALIVDDAKYFQDGTWGSSLSARNADWIAIGTVGNVVQISSINYATNTITLASPITWADNAPIWLYKDSSGNRVLYGTAPEIGAYEYTEDPTNPITKVGTGVKIIVGAGAKIIIKEN